MLTHPSLGLGPFSKHSLKVLLGDPPPGTGFCRWLLIPPCSASPGCQGPGSVPLTDGVLPCGCRGLLGDPVPAWLQTAANLGTPALSRDENLTVTFQKPSAVDSLPQPSWRVLWSFRVPVLLVPQPLPGLVEGSHPWFLLGPPLLACSGRLGPQVRSRRG